jgi:hypothetical protein
MRRSVFIAGLAAALVLGIGVFGTGRKGSVTRAQQTTSATEVKIDNFRFRSSNAYSAGGNYSYVDQPRRYPSQHRQHR